MAGECDYCLPAWDSSESCHRSTYLTAPGTVVAVLTGSATRLDASSASHRAAFPCRPGRPVDMRRAWEVFVAVPGKADRGAKSVTAILQVLFKQ